MTSSSVPHAKTVGFILDFIHGYQETVWLEVSKNLKAAGASQVVFIGESFLKGAEGTEIATNNVFKMAFCEWIDAFLLSGATLGSYISKEEYAECLKAYRAKKCVSIGACGDGMPSVVIENRIGMRSLIDHLAGIHGRKRIAYLSGPKASVEADERLAAYREGLTAAGLAYDPNLVYVGNFWYNSGKDGVAEFLDVRKAEFDAIVAANDYMALGAMRELTRRGIGVPQEIAVSGYDDVLEAECESPALTTVRQPIPAQAEAAVRFLLDAGASAPAPLKTQAVFRRSCGCQPLDLELASRVQTGSAIAEEAEIAESLAKVVAFTVTTPQTVASLISTCVKDAKTGAFDRFFQDSESAIYRGVDGGDNPDSWQNAVSVIRSAVWPRVSGLDGVYSLENAVGKLRIMIGNLEANRLRLAKSKEAVFNETLSQTLKEVGKAQDLKELGNIARENLGNLGLKSFYLAVRADKDPDCGPEFGLGEDLILYAAVIDGKDALASSGPRRYAAKEFLPRDVLPNRLFDFVAMPLTSGLNFHGVAVFEPGPADGTVYTRITNQLSAAVHNTLVVSSWKEAEKSIAEKSSRVVALARPISESVLAAGALASKEASTIEAVGEAARKTKADIAQTESAISKMAEKARSIKEYIAVIEDISSTISLLGLNAAIEAARAGQSGKGFNVIASEIRKLSESTRLNVERIGSTLNELSGEAERSVVSAKRSSDAFTALDAELESVLGALKDISGRLDSLSTSSQELIETI
jgi:DNA-binding LacI/PurR family transcriptional regulator